MSVPKGSVLGPLLFIIYLLPLYCYADDSGLQNLQAIFLNLTVIKKKSFLLVQKIICLIPVIFHVYWWFYNNFL